MAAYDRMKTLSMMLETGLVPLFHHTDPKTALAVAEACHAGGARVLEFTNRGEGAVETFGALQRSIRKQSLDMTLGAGSIVDEPTAALFIAQGADFIVGPTFNQRIALLCNRRRIPYIPGCGTVTEISNAEEYGAEVVKVFPAGCAGGPDFIKSLLGPCPRSKLMPTGGVEANAESISAWIMAGVACIGMGSNLIGKGFVEKGQFTVITDLTAKLLAWIALARRG